MTNFVYIVIKPATLSVMCIIQMREGTHNILLTVYFYATSLSVK